MDTQHTVMHDKINVSIAPTVTLCKRTTHLNRVTELEKLCMERVNKSNASFDQPHQVQFSLQNNFFFLLFVGIIVKGAKSKAHISVCNYKVIHSYALLYADLSHKILIKQIRFSKRCSYIFV